MTQTQALSHHIEMTKWFDLKSFAKSSDGVQINVTPYWNKQNLIVEFQIDDPQDKILWQTHNNQNDQGKELYKRSHELWKHTCFEFFFKIPHKDEYWEMNMSLSKEWNVYHFTKYREGMSEENRVKTVQLDSFHIKEEKTIYAIAISIEELMDSVNNLERLQMGISMVIENKNHEISYWAVHHPSSKPDFHDAAGFCIPLVKQ